MKPMLPLRPRALRRTAVAALVAACCAHGGAAPTLPTVVAGQASFAQQGNVFSITNTPNAIINWHSFSVGAGEITRFIQQDAHSAVLNRITGQDPSRILGALQSNGQVFLINPNGIMFGKDARIDVAGLAASTLALSNTDFLSGRRNFTDSGQAGALTQAGTIGTPAGGQVLLVAPEVENSGVISTPQGQLVLAAGRSVRLVDAGNRELQVLIAAPAGQAVNLGQLIAAGGQVGMYGALVRQRGLASADSAVVGASGKIVFQASGDTLLEGGSVTSATGAGRGGQVQVLGTRVALLGDARIDASGNHGGGTVLVGGDYQGKNPQLANASLAWLGQGAAIRADALERGDGGRVIVWADDATSAYGSVSVRGGAAGGNGGFIETSGHALATTGVRIDAGAPHGTAGTWLLDPANIVVATGGGATLADVSAFANMAGNTATIDPGTIAAATADVVMQASNGITFDNDLTVGGGHSLRATAGGAVNVNAAINTTGSGAVTITGDDFYFDDGTITTAGGNVTLNGASLNLYGVAAINAGSGTISLNMSSAVDTDSGMTSLLARGLNISSPYASLGGAVDAGNGSVSISTDSLSLVGGIDASGGSVALRPYTAATPVEVGADANTDANYLVLALTDSTLDRISARTLSVGDTSATSTLTVTGALDLRRTLATGTTLALRARSGIAIDGDVQVGGTLSLRSTNGDIGESGSITAARLSASGVAVALGGSNTVASLSGSATGGNFDFSSGVALSVSSLSASGDVSLAAPGLSGGGISANALALQSSGGIGLDTDVSTVSASNTSSGGEAIVINNASPLTVSGVSQGSSGPVSISSIGGLTLGAAGAISANGGAITLLTHSPMLLDGDVASNGGAISLQAPLGSIAVGSGGSVNAGAGNLSLAAASIDNAGSLTTSSGAISLTATTINNSGSITSSSGNITLTGAVTNTGSVATGGQISGLTPPTVAQCVAAPTLPGCASLLSATLAACTIDPNGPDCSLVLPTLAQCIATPTLTGCSVVLPTLAQCVATPALAGCSVVLPTLAQCVATPTLAGCSVVLPTLAQCAANPNLAGCSVVLPTLAQCVAAPTLAGCAVVLPTLAQCVAAPTLAGCSVVLPTLAQCIANPALAGCSAVLPTLSQCAATPTLAGCTVVLPTLAQCVATPTLQGCGAVLPSVDQCVRDPLLPACQLTGAPVVGVGVVSPLQENLATTTLLIDSTRTAVLPTSAGEYTPLIMPPAPVKPELKSEQKIDAKPTDKSAIAGDQNVKKLYCN